MEITQRTWLASAPLRSIQWQGNHPSDSTRIIQRTVHQTGLERQHVDTTSHQTKATLTEIVKLLFIRV